jgi:D-amino-acid oxidase
MKCASDINQYRLHRGYHYPRSRETIQECLGGLKPFKRKYEDSVVSRNINHYYAIAKSGSLVSVDEYLQVLDSMELNYEKVESFNGTDLTIKVDEELFDSEKLRNQSIQKMKGVGVNVILNRQTIKEDFDDYDYVVIATYSKINELLDEKRLYQFEVVEKPVVRLPDSYKNKSIVVMDGPFMCLDPYKDGLHVLGNVRHAIHSTNVGYKPIIRNKHLKEYLNSGVISNLKVTKIKKFIEDGMKFFEDFNELEHIGSMFTIRTVLANRDYDDARPTFVVKETDKVFSIFSGKIGTCVHAANQLVGELKG